MSFGLTGNFDPSSHGLWRCSLAHDQIMDYDRLELFDPRGSQCSRRPALIEIKAPGLRGLSEHDVRAKLSDTLQAKRAPGRSASCKN